MMNIRKNIFYLKRMGQNAKYLTCASIYRIMTGQIQKFILTVKNAKETKFFPLTILSFKSTVVRHRQSLRSADCFNNLFNNLVNKLSPDSKIVQKFSCEQTKAQTNNKLSMYILGPHAELSVKNNLSISINH